MADQPAQGARTAVGNGGSAQSRSKKDGRNAYMKTHRDKREEDGESRARKRRRLEEADPNEKTHPFSQEEIAAEERRPKRKVAVLIGYSGTGYKGMQVNPNEKTIEGDLFAAMIAAGAISKANADDPKKSSFSRCARTDKGVHAVGNVISLKMIIEDEDIVARINAHLPPQIRVWGITRTINSFNCYQSCDSRWYEYLMPSYCLLPPHPESYLWKKVVEAAKEAGTYEDVQEKMKDVSGFWEEVEEKDIRPIMEGLDPETLAQVRHKKGLEEQGSDSLAEDDGKSEASPPRDSAQKPPSAADGGSTVAEARETEVSESATSEESLAARSREGESDLAGETVVEDREKTSAVVQGAITGAPPGLTPVDLALYSLRQAYITAKRRYRVSPIRLQQFQAALDTYVGTKSFHNYTIHKNPGDPSAKRHIRSFVVDPNPVVIGDTEWLSLKVHGQSFMMHQIRKMVCTASMVVRCATPLSRMEESFTKVRLAIPKAPGLGLWLERPMFDGYNRTVESRHQKEKIDFVKFEDQMREFKDREIYKRIFETEAAESVFHSFFQTIDNFRVNYFLWYTAAPLEQAAKGMPERGTKAMQDFEEKLGGDEEDDPEGGEG